MTVGKIYVGLLIAENWKAYKASQSSSFGLKIVSTFFSMFMYMYTTFTHNVSLRSDIITKDLLFVCCTSFLFRTILAVIKVN